MAATRTDRAATDKRESVFWLQLAVVGAVILVLLAVIWALFTAAKIESGGARSATERQMRELEARVEANPDSAAVWGALIRAQSRAGKLQAAERSIREADEALGTRAAAVAIEVARIALIREDVETALTEIDAALVLVDQEVKAEVARLAQKGVAMEPEMDLKVDALLLKADILAASNDPSGAVAAYTEALELNPVMADVLVERGLLYAEMGRADEAEADFTRAMAFIPDYAPAIAALEQLERQ